MGAKIKLGCKPFCPRCLFLKNLLFVDFSLLVLVKLDAIMQRHGLRTQARHRAMGDVDMVLAWLAGAALIFLAACNQVPADSSAAVGLDSALLIEGLTSKLIGRRLAISPRTVDVYRARLMRKYEAATTPELVHKLLSA